MTENNIGSPRWEKASSASIDKQANVSEFATVGRGTKVWGLTQIREHARVGAGCTVGRNVYLGPGVVVGDCCKIQNSALVYEPATLSSGVFIGPGAVLTNDRFPRAINPDGSLKDGKDWELVGVVVEEGASIGAMAVCIGPVRVGQWAMVAAGAVVTEDVRNFSLVRGVPAKHVGWVGKAGALLQESGGRFLCPVTGQEYTESLGVLIAGRTS